MNMEEQREIIAHVGDYLQGQVPLVCGTGRYDTLNTIKMSQFAQEHGCLLYTSIAFLASEAAGYITGTDVEITGGKYAVQNSDWPWEIKRERIF